MDRRRYLQLSSGVFAAAGSGCAALGDSNDARSDPATGSDDAQPPRAAHTVSVYLADRDAGREVSVRIESANGDVLFERQYSLSDGNEADEDATFPASTDPETVVVTVDGTTFERAWPTALGDDACSDGNWTGVELYVQGEPGADPTLRVDRNCQHVTEPQ